MGMYKRPFVTLIFLTSLANATSDGALANSSSSNLCWRSLAPDTGNQDVQVARTDLALASKGPDEIWLSWEEDGPHIMRWFKGEWASMSIPLRQDTEKMRYPLVAAGALGDLILAASANGQEGTSALHIARWSEDTWEWIGAPIISSQLPFTHAHEPSIAFDNKGYPIVAWSEERNITLTGLFVVQWDGSSWQRLGTLSPKDDGYHLSPTVIVSPDKSIWIGWREGCGILRIARWDGKAWRDIGRKALRKLTAGTCSSAHLSLKVDSKGQAWALRTTSKRSGKSSLSLVRWDGSHWNRVSLPHAQTGKDSTVWSSHMILRNDRPIVAWSQSDATDNHRLYVSEWMENDRWQPLISGLHLVEGVSNVREIRLSLADEQSFFISWDEIGKNKRRTRLVQAYVCKTGETPALPPKSLAERDAWPSSVEEAARHIAGKLDDESKARVQSTKVEDLILYHHGWGTGIRNSLGLWRGNEKLLKSCGQGKVIHPDECSMIIIKAVWKLLQ